MSLIHTCELCGANPFDYLTELQRHADELARNPAGGLVCPRLHTLSACTTPQVPVMSLACTLLLSERDHGINANRPHARNRTSK